MKITIFSGDGKSYSINLWDGGLMWLTNQDQQGFEIDKFTLFQLLDNFFCEHYFNEEHKDIKTNY